METDDKQLIFEKIFKEHLKIETYSKSIESIYSPRLLTKINYKPYYQRNYVWDYNKATYFIESILLGTEIPPLVFFDNNTEIEIIDGRQRFETILRFINGQFSLKAKGLNVLKQLKNKDYNDFIKHDKEIIDNFLDAKLRIIEFKLVNEPKLDKILEDKIKKEIFSRYNSGITPLKRAEIDNAIFDEDSLSTVFKETLEKNIVLQKQLYSTFFKPKESKVENPPIEDLMNFIRRNLVLPMLPISYYAQGTGRNDLLKKLYEKFSDDATDVEKAVVNSFLQKANFVRQIQEFSERNNLNINRLALDCCIWALGILDLEEIQIAYNDTVLVTEIAEYIHDHIESFSELNYNFIKEVSTRYLTIGLFFANKYKIDISIYISLNDIKRLELRELRKPNDTSSRLSELEALRLNKPEPSRNSIDDIIRAMQRGRFLVRPSYQRKEVINPSKASSIIESIILGISLPALFIYKRKDGVSEVIDGQQRILTLLGYLGKEYLNEKSVSTPSKNHRFRLRKLRILKELEGKRFDEVAPDLQDKIFDFPLYIVEIDENQNPFFDPIDLFIRLNDKPFPIREHSFEMWNSWVDVEITSQIKSLTEAIKPWFYVRQLNSVNDRDRMENEELIASLAFLEYSTSIQDSRKTLDIYQVSGRLNARVSNKAYISNLLQDITENDGKSKIQFAEAIKGVKSFIKKLKLVLLDCDRNKDDLFPYLKNELDGIFKTGKQILYFRRTMQDFYMLWYLLSSINLEMVRHNRVKIKQELYKIFKYFKNIPDQHLQNSKGYQEFEMLASQFKNQYAIDERKIQLSEQQRSSLIVNQNNICSISGAPMFLGDDLEVDHEFPLSKGGKDEMGNLKMAFKESNRSKGSKI